ncbi:MAG TPA: flagellar biosynthetic protein FliR [Candidatus Dormibacteraeota bacterium]|nr:flagellar biosynthetic protein FliR [Candidatus Dormibacteraeota bacterium]
MTAAAPLVFARCAGFAFRAPGISYPGVPPAARVALALFLTIALLPAVHAASADGAALAAGVALEFVIGSAIGTGASVLYDAAYAAGRAIDDYVGVKAIAPSIQLVAPSGFGRIWSLAFTAAFFLLGAYRPVIAAFAGSFVRLPPGALPDQHAWTAYASAVATLLPRAALAIAAPAIAAGFMAQFALGALSRTIPRFGSLTLSFPLVFGVALVACVLGLPAIAARLAPIFPSP